MPVKPYTLATRIVHLGQYSPDAHDLRVLPTFLGSRQFVRGYGWGSLRCQVDESECGAFEELLGSRLLVGNVEVRAPLLRYSEPRASLRARCRCEGFLFADSGLVWSRSAAVRRPSR